MLYIRREVFIRKGFGRSAKDSVVNCEYDATSEPYDFVTFIKSCIK